MKEISAAAALCELQAEQQQQDCIKKQRDEFKTPGKKNGSPKVRQWNSETSINRN